MSGNNGNVDFWMAKLDSGGVLQWQKCYGGSNGESAKKVVKTSDSGFLVCGYTGSNDSDLTINYGASNYWIIKTDSLGNLQWQKSIGGWLEDYAYSVIPWDGDGLVVIGRTTSDDIPGFIGGINCHGGSNNCDDILIAKLSSSSMGVLMNHFPDDELNVYYNESDSYLQIDYSSKKDERNLLELFDVLGNLIYYEWVENKTGLNKHFINTDKFTKGIYFLRFAKAEEFLSRKIILR